MPQKCVRVLGTAGAGHPAAPARREQKLLPPGLPLRPLSSSRPSPHPPCRQGHHRMTSFAPVGSASGPGLGVTWAHSWNKGLQRARPFPASGGADLLFPSLCQRHRLPRGSPTGSSSGQPQVTPKVRKLNLRGLRPPASDRLEDMGGHRP